MYPSSQNNSPSAVPSASAITNNDIEFIRLKITNKCVAMTSLNVDDLISEQCLPELCRVGVLLRRNDVTTAQVQLNGSCHVNSHRLLTSAKRVIDRCSLLWIWITIKWIILLPTNINDVTAYCVVVVPACIWNVVCQLVCFFNLQSHIAMLENNPQKEVIKVCWGIKKVIQGQELGRCRGLNPRRKFGRLQKFLHRMETYKYLIFKTNNKIRGFKVS